MTLITIRNHLKNILNYENQNFGVHKLDATKEKALCLFVRSSAPNNIAIGGIEATTYTPLFLSLYVRWGSNAQIAESKARELFKPLETDRFVINELNCNVATIFSSPVFLGTDDKGIYEFSIDFNLNYERND